MSVAPTSLLSVGQEHPSTIYAKVDAVNIGLLQDGQQNFTFQRSMTYPSAAAQIQNTADEVLLVARAFCRNLVEQIAENVAFLTYWVHSGGHN
jgi:hypothetical protein